MSSADPIRFVDAANTDPDLNARVNAAFEKGAMRTAEEIMRLANEAGFDFTREEFESAVRKNLQQRFAGGAIELADVVLQSKKEPLESSCAKGCLSYTKSWHPSDFHAYDPQAGT
jgi:predicted ribosomally synthesized peptide with nif11-like leader